MTPRSASEIEAVMRDDSAVNQAFVAAYRRTVPDIVALVFPPGRLEGRSGD
ncbi:MAG: hypothetical protein IPL75_03820 [Acidobacteria bacterium]|nr:hypothetical protein [Acidobacteriota bacterium]